MKSLIVLSLFGLVFGRPDIGLELRKKPLQTSYGVPVESVTGLPPSSIIQNYLPPSPTFQTPLVSTAVPFYSGPTISPTFSPPIVYDQSFISQIPSQHHQQTIYQPQYYSQPSGVIHHHHVDQQPTQVQKHVYFYEAPEEPEVIQPHVAPTAPPSKKNVKIIFIKAPTYRVQPYVQPFVYPQQQEKTLVYVLVKKPDEQQQQIVVEPPPPTPPSKPEVYFIKYKNQAEAEEKVQNTLNTHAESGANVITDHVDTGSSLIGNVPINTVPIGSVPIGNVNLVTTPSPIITDYISSSTPGTFLNPSISISTNGISGGQFVSSTETPFVTSTYGPPISISSTESPIVSSTYYPSIDANKIVDSYGVPHQTYGAPSKK